MLSTGLMIGASGPMDMNTCSCKGVRTCLVCEREGAIPPSSKQAGCTLYQCHRCGELSSDAIQDPGVPPLYRCPRPCINSAELRTKGDSDMDIVGTIVIKNFVSSGEEERITAIIDECPWVGSQEGRKKQDYGVKVNFKQRKIQLGNFRGLPQFSKPLIEMMKTRVPELHSFIPVEVCNLEYVPERGSAIVPHVDDSWLWGPRLVTITLLSSTLMTFTNYSTPQTEICIPLPRKSLLVIEGVARYKWMHSIKRQHIMLRRLGITFRELSDEFLPGGSQDALGYKILELAARFSDKPSN